MPYKFLEGVTRADIAFEATGKTLSELFRSAGEAVLDSMANVKSIKPKIEKKVTLKGDDVKELLFLFLEEIVFLKDKDNIVFCLINDVKVDEKKLEAKATLEGDSIRPTEQELHQDVKAVTMHYYKVEKTKTGWKTQVVLDI